MKKQEIRNILSDLHKLMVRVENLQKESATPEDAALLRGLWIQLSSTHWELRWVWKHL